MCTPNDGHFDLLEQALRAGKHVICEKPLATSITEAARLTELAAEAGVVTSVPFVLPLLPHGARSARMCA